MTQTDKKPYLYDAEYLGDGAAVKSAGHRVCIIRQIRMILAATHLKK